MKVWIFDDPIGVSDDETLFRRVRAIPDQILDDPLTGRRELRMGALRVDVDSGLSIYLETLLPVHDLTQQDLFEPEREHLVAFPVVVPRRRGWGVIEERDEEDLPRGLAHGLVRASVPNPDRDARKRVREDIIEACYWACAC